MASLSANAVITAESVCDVGRSFDEALLGARGALEQGLPIDRQMAELLRHELELSDSRSLPKIRRLLKLLATLRCDAQVLPIKSSLLSDPDPYVRSEGVLMIARATRSPAAVSRRLLDPDPRVQANAVEGLWGVDTPDARELALSVLKSPHARVVANAMVGLYRLQDLDSISRLMDMAESAREDFRVSARWAMGETGDPRFIPFLQAAYRTDTPKCRVMTLRSLKRLRDRVMALEQAGSVEMRAIESSVQPNGNREIVFSVLRMPSDPALAIRCIDLAVREGSVWVHRIGIQELPSPDICGVGFAVPRILGLDDPYRIAIEKAIQRTLRMKRKADPWALERCLYGKQSEAEMHDLVEPNEHPAVVLHRRQNRGFLTDPVIIEKVIPGPGPRAAASVDMATAIRKLIDSVGRVSGGRHIFVFVEPESPVGDHEVEELRKEAKEATVVVHAVAPDDGGARLPIESLCEATGGGFHRLSFEGFSEEFPKIYQALRNRYRMTYAIPEVEGRAETAEVSFYGQQACGRFTAILK